jgi:hypothetical protein
MEHIKNIVYFVNSSHDDFRLAFIRADGVMSSMGRLSDA